MKTLLHDAERAEILARLKLLRPDSPGLWGKLSPHQLICHLSDSFRMSLGEKKAAPVHNVATRSLLKWAALWAPLRWPHGTKTLPEVDQQLGGTPPSEFTADLNTLLSLFEKFCACQGPFAEHPIFGPLSRSERMRHAYLHMDHHLRQFGLSTAKNPVL